MATQQGDKKIYAFGDKAQEKLAAGLKEGAKIVGSTLGLAGSNTLIEKKFGTPDCVDDGITTINNLILPDELENLGITSLVEAADKTSEYVGDGTSTTIVLTKAIYDAGRKQAGGELIIGGKTPFEIKKEIDEARELVVEKLNKSAKPIKTKEDIRAVAYSAYSNDKMADVVANLIEKVGKDGIVIVEEGWGRETETELLTGMQFAGKLANALFSNVPQDGLNLDRFPILVSDYDFVNVDDIVKIINIAKLVAEKGEKGLLIVANKYERVVIDQIIKNNLLNAQKGSQFRMYFTRTPSFTPSEFDDFAVFVGARYFSKEKDDDLAKCKYEELGRASKFKISKSGDGVVLGGAGSKADINKKIVELKLKLADEKVKLLKARLQQRIASLSSAIGIIKVASPSKGETEHNRLKTRNAVKSCQAAMAEGIIEGGGLALKKISDELPEDNILKEALKVPYNVIQENAGGKLKIKGVFDAVKVIRTALEQACSQAWQLVNTKTIIAFKSERNFYESAEMVVDKLKEKK